MQIAHSFSAWIWELLRRLKLPPVSLAPQAKTATEIYLTAQGTAGQKDFQPLAQIWIQRLASSAG
jgi:hypothetical protein